MTGEELRSVLRERRMTSCQIAVVAICVAINFIDGIDVLAMALTAPAIAREWALGPAHLGELLSASLLGMTVGALVVSPLADLAGRRTMILWCLVFMSAGMLLSSTAGSPAALAISRVIAGIGVGGMTSCTGTLVVEYASARRRELSLGWVTIGYPVGAVVSGAVAAYLIGAFGWRSVFLVGAVASLVLLPIAFRLLPESIELLMARRPRGALQKINAILDRLSLTRLAQLPETAAPATKRASSLLDIVRGDLLGRTVTVCCVYFLYMLSFYFILNWATQLTTELGFSDRSGISMSVLTNLAGVAGGLSMGALAARFGVMRATVGVVTVMALAIAAFGVSPASLILLGIASAFIGFAMYAAAVGIYSIVAAVYPADVRATGLGVAISCGRFGSMFGPYLGGVLLAYGLERGAICVLLALPALLAAGLVTRAAKSPAQEVGAAATQAAR